MANGWRSLCAPPRWIAFAALGVVVLASLGLHLWGIGGDLPYAPDVDEPLFVGAAVKMLRERSLDPGWFGNPGSTVIYPIATLVEGWYLAARHLPPFAHAMPGIGREFDMDPTPFYLIGRLVSVTYGLGCLVATWLVGRRLVGDFAAVLAAALLLATPIVVAYGQLVRTDLAGTFYALLALWMSMRAVDRGRFRDWALAAAAIGLALSTRWFFAVLIVPYGVAALFWLRSTRIVDVPGMRLRTTATKPVLGFFLAPMAFALTSPFVLLSPARVLADLRLENRSTHPGADGLSPLGNLAWYLGDVIPTTVGPVILGLALLGIVVLVRTRPRDSVLLLTFAATYLVGVSLSPLHWARYVIPLVPVVGIFAAGGAVAIGDAVARWIHRGVNNDLSEMQQAAKLPSGVRQRPVALTVASAMLLLVLIPSIGTVAANSQRRATPSTRVDATEWIARNLPEESRIAGEMYTAYLDRSRDEVLVVFALGQASLDWYRSHGYRYLMTSSAMSNRFGDAARYPEESTFYRLLSETAHLLVSFEPRPAQSGPRIAIYDIGP
jgi:hypothetical protein